MCSFIVGKDSAALVTDDTENLFEDKGVLGNAGIELRPILLLSCLYLLPAKVLVAG